MENEKGITDKLKSTDIIEIKKQCAENTVRKEFLP